MRSLGRSTGLLLLLAVLAVVYFLTRKRTTAGTTGVAAKSAAGGAPWGEIVNGGLRLFDSVVGSLGGRQVSGGAGVATGAGVPDVIQAGAPSAPIEV